MILEAVNQNPSFQLVIVYYNSSGGIKRDELKDFFGDSNNPKSIKRNVTIIFDSFKDFTNNYPENKTYSEDETIQS